MVYRGIWNQAWRLHTAETERGMSCFHGSGVASAATAEQLFPSDLDEHDLAPTTTNTLDLARFERTIVERTAADAIAAAGAFKTEEQALAFSSHRAPHPGTLKRLMKELRNARTNPAAPGALLRIGPVVPLGCAEDDARVDMLHWHAILAGPPGTPYEGGRFLVELHIPDDYPFKPPKNRFVTRVFSPNINSLGGHCLDVDNTMWSPSLTLETLCLYLLGILCDPSPDDPLVAEVAALYRRDRAAFEATCCLWTRRYARLLDRWRFWARVAAKLVLCHKRSRGIRPGGAQALKAQAEFEELTAGMSLAGIR